MRRMPFAPDQLPMVKSVVPVPETASEPPSSIWMAVSSPAFVVQTMSLPASAAVPLAMRSGFGSAMEALLSQMVSEEEGTAP